MPNQPNQPPWEAMPLRDKDWVDFHCRLCGQCCRDIEDSVMVESLDACRIAKYLRDHEDPEMDVSTFCLKYTHEVLLTEGFPAMTLNTDGPDRSCVFLKENRCTIYPARPRVCRHYPFSVGPGSRGRDFVWFLCKDKPFHLAGGRVQVKDWINRSFPSEEREFLKRQFDFYGKLGKILQGMDEKTREQLLQQIVFLCYINYDLDEPFLPQYGRNMDALLKTLRQ